MTGHPFRWPRRSRGFDPLLLAAAAISLFWVITATVAFVVFGSAA